MHQGKTSCCSIATHTTRVAALTLPVCPANISGATLAAQPQRQHLRYAVLPLVGVLVLVLQLLHTVLLWWCWQQGLC